MAARRQLGAMALAVALGAGLPGCASSGSAKQAAEAESRVTTPSPSAAKAPIRSGHARARLLASSPSSSPRPAHPAFRWHASRVDAGDLGKSWHSGCPVGPASLRALSMTIWGFDRTAHRGTLIVGAASVPAYVAAFRTLYRERFPIRLMVPVSAYGGSDNRSMAADNTSAFNCRYAVSDGPKAWSMHAYGEAVDINPRENPYRLDGKVLPPSGAAYMNRSNVRRGMVVAGSVPVRAFAAVGWGWGGLWSSSPDYQHFSSNGK